MTKKFRTIIGVSFVCGLSHCTLKASESLQDIKAQQNPGYSRTISHQHMSYEASLPDESLDPVLNMSSHQVVTSVPSSMEEQALHRWKLCSLSDGRNVSWVWIPEVFIRGQYVAIYYSTPFYPQYNYGSLDTMSNFCGSDDDVDFEFQKQREVAAISQDLLRKLRQNETHIQDEGVFINEEISYSRITPVGFPNTDPQSPITQVLFFDWQYLPFFEPHQSGPSDDLVELLSNDTHVSASGMRDLSSVTTTSYAAQPQHSSSTPTTSEPTIEPSINETKSAPIGWRAISESPGIKMLELHHLSSPTQAPRNRATIAPCVQEASLQASAKSGIITSFSSQRKGGLSPAKTKRIEVGKREEGKHLSITQPSASAVFTKAAAPSYAQALKNGKRQTTSSLEKKGNNRKSEPHK